MLRSLHEQNHKRLSGLVLHHKKDRSRLAASLTVVDAHVAARYPGMTGVCSVDILPPCWLRKLAPKSARRQRLLLHGLWHLTMRHALHVLTKEGERQVWKTLNEIARAMGPCHGEVEQHLPVLHSMINMHVTSRGLPR
jgi:hypothetical protein